MNVLLSLFFALIVGIQYVSALTINMASGNFFTGSCIPFYLDSYTVSSIAPVTVELYYAAIVTGSSINSIQVSANLTPYCMPIPFNLAPNNTPFYFFLHTVGQTADAGGTQKALIKTKVVEPFSNSNIQIDNIQGNQIIPIAIAVTNSTNPSTAYYLFATTSTPADYTAATPVSLIFFENYSAYFGLTQGLIPNVTAADYFVTFAEGNTASEATLGYSKFHNVPQPLIQTAYIPRALF